MQTIKFSYNWNNKLDCNYFTTLRLYSDRFVGDHIVVLKDKEIGVATAVGSRKIMMDDLNEYIAGLDTGYSAKECKAILRKMYPNANWQTQALSFVLFKMIKRYESKKNG